MKKNEEIILDTSDEAAHKETREVWISKGGFMHSDERSARYAGATHNACKQCGKPTLKGWIKCEECRAIDHKEAYSKLPYEKWDGVKPLCLYDGDEYFFDEDDLTGYIEDNDLKPEDLMLVICVPNYAGDISTDIWEDSFPADGDGEIEELEKLVNEFNEKLKKLKPLSYSPGKVRTAYQV